MTPQDRTRALVSRAQHAAMATMLRLVSAGLLAMGTMLLAWQGYGWLHSGAWWTLSLGTLLPEVSNEAYRLVPGRPGTLDALAFVIHLPLAMLLAFAALVCRALSVVEESAAASICMPVDDVPRTTAEASLPASDRRLQTSNEATV